MIISYDGSRYAGFQSQRGRHQTVQETLEAAVSKISGHPVQIAGSGRTDAGVHALAQVVNFHTRGSIPTQRIQTALNSILPYDITVKEVVEVSESFHARFSAVAKTYIYQVYTAKNRPAIGYQYVYHHPMPLDFEVMQQTSEDLCGEHDFASFCASGSNIKSTRRIIFQLDLVKQKEKIYFVISANGYLYQMVRSIVGTLLEIGRGKKAPVLIKDLLQTPDRSKVGVTAPAKGLFLARVYYEKTELFPCLEDFLDKGISL